MTNETTTVATVAKSEGLQMFSSKDGFELGMRMAKMFSESTLVPMQFQKNIANCTIGLELANRIGASPLMVMQNLCIVHGNPTFSAKFLIACINASGKFATPVRYEFKGKEGTDDWGCRVYVVDKEGETLHGSWVTIRMAKAEGWYGKNGSKWQTMPELMLQYRAAAFFQRVYCPEISLGLQTAEEMYDTYEELPNDEPTATEQAVNKESAQNANSEELAMEEPAPTAESQPEAEKKDNKATPEAAQPIKQDIPDMFK